jgi:RIO kinase 1
LVGRAPRFELADIQFGQEVQEDDGERNPTGLTILNEFYEQALITEVMGLVKSGKEATVYACRAHPRTGHAFLAAKIYRERDNRTFKNDAIYWAGAKVGKRREQLAFQKKTKQGLAVQAGAWQHREYKTLSLLHAAGAAVPAPVATKGGAFLME